MRLHSSPQDHGFEPFQASIDWWRFANSGLNTSFVSIGNEWLAFMGRRVNESLHLWQEVAGAKTPQAIWVAYSHFWQKAVEDYWNAYAPFARFSGTSLEDLTVGQPPREEASLHAKAA